MNVCLKVSDYLCCGKYERQRLREENSSLHEQIRMIQESNARLQQSLDLENEYLKRNIAEIKRLDALKRNPLFITSSIMVYGGVALTFGLISGASGPAIVASGVALLYQFIQSHQA